MRPDSHDPSRLALYDRLRRAIVEEALPCAVVDLDAFDENLTRTLERARGKPLRIATKSVRAPLLLTRLLDRGGERCRGLMCFTAAEAAFLADEGHDDLLVAYPSLAARDLALVARATAAGKKIRMVVDSAAHLEALDRAAREASVTISAVAELDVSWRPLAGVHVGTRRSPLRDAAALLRLFEHARGLRGVALRGLMAYEAHIAGVPDSAPGSWAVGAATRLMKRLARPAATRLRGQAVAALREAGFALDLVNGAGTGSLEAAAREEALTEVTAGSAFLAPHLFDGYAGLDLRPSAFFACPIVRSSDAGFVTCLGGGWIASGGAGPDRLPVPWLPPGIELLPLEGAGEVQTPLDVRRAPRAPSPGDPVFFRHAKAGELAERVNELVLVSGDRIVGRAPTYRGLGRAFL